jgi:asparagine synthase (glutamine-hydrolysing)
LVMHYTDEGIVMCGIAGILNFNGRPVSLEELSNLTGALAHRGRDCAAHIVGGNPNNSLSAYAGIGLGHRRLSILDLSDQASQPMRSLNSESTIVYNGELFNYRELRSELLKSGYRFRTDSDTEVVLAAYDAWGENCLQHFNGMFAFSIWDEASRSLFCARDPIGIKPFYYSLDGNGFSFASESQALARLNGNAHDLKAIACYFLSMYVPRRLSIYSGVEKLLPGHFMRIRQNGDVTVRKFWSIPTASRTTVSNQDAVKELTEKLDLAVKAQLQSDVPVGALLSGGFDSGMIVASAARTGTPIHTYSVGFDDLGQESELAVAKSMALRYKTIHHERVIASSEVIGLLNKAIGSLSEPLADSAIVPTYCLAGMAADDGVKVLLSGTGGDEVFAGYSRYVATTQQRRMLLTLPRALRKFLGNTVFSSSLFGARLSHPSLDMMLCTGGSPALARQLFDDDRAFLLFIEEIIESELPKPARLNDSLYENMEFDLQVYVPDLLLMLLDQLTMAHTVEGRVPLLDLNLIAAAYSLPSAFHASPGSPITRQLMRKMAIDRVDDRTFTAQKLGFSGPISSWIHANQSIFLDKVMSARSLPGMDNMLIEKRWHEGIGNPTKSWAMEMFSLYSFSHWCGTHMPCKNQS